MENFRYMENELKSPRRFKDFYRKLEELKKKYMNSQEFSKSAPLQLLKDSLKSFELEKKTSLIKHYLRKFLRAKLNIDIDFKKVKIYYFFKTSGFAGMYDLNDKTIEINLYPLLITLYELPNYNMYATSYALKKAKELSAEFSRDSYFIRLILTITHELLHHVFYELKLSKKFKEKLESIKINTASVSQDFEELLSKISEMVRVLKENNAISQENYDEIKGSEEFLISLIKSIEEKISDRVVWAEIRNIENMSSHEEYFSKSAKIMEENIDVFFEYVIESIEEGKNKIHSEDYAKNLKNLEKEIKKFNSKYRKVIAEKIRETSLLCSIYPLFDEGFATILSGCFIWYFRKKIGLKDIKLKEILNFTSVIIGYRKNVIILKKLMKNKKEFDFYAKIISLLNNEGSEEEIKKIIKETKKLIEKVNAHTEVMKELKNTF